MSRDRSDLRSVTLIPLALVLALGGIGCGRGEGVGNAEGVAKKVPVGGPPSVLLVTLDTWRWDHIGASGSGLVETPRLDALARRGLYVRRVQSTCPLTTPAHASILTGLWPSKHGVRDNFHFSLKEGVPTLAAAFGREGYATGAMVSAAPVRRTYGLDRGFAHYDDQGIRHESDDAIVPASRPGAATVERALAWLGERSPGSPVFLWVHLYEPHAPYAPPPAYAERYPGRPYAGEVAYSDELIGRLLDAVEADARRDWVVAVTGDHGEGLGDHGEETHGLLLYGSTVDVPLLLWRASPLPEAGRGPFSLVDVAPTLAALAGLKPFPCDGTDLFGPDPGPRWLAAESAFPALSLGLAPPIRLRRGTTAFLDQGGGPEVYDLGADPMEGNDLSGSSASAGLVRDAARVRQSLFGASMEADLTRGTLKLSGEEMAALKSLGYIGGGPSGGKFERVDLRRFASEFSGLQVARRACEARRYEEAARIYGAFLKKYPRASKVHQELGTTYLRMNRPDEAEACFVRALKADPADAVSSLNLGNLRMMKQDPRGAERFFLQSLRAEEAQPEVHLNLGLLYADFLQRPGEAGRHLSRFLELAPEDPEAPQVRAMLARLGGG